ncbi:ABC transporter substrate-binding protein [Helcobacillus massiliensis]|uniref:ABC transporter substrate-binding protein n=1 Tax=Helcobacillus massiliensis TaxID=521392 RepID=UPI0021A37E3C|nr:ABC transporter substrate-binding protein [Helcobacillus massiliensis]MCT1557552.1 ABC transporter substrate-binding protein [Helcobacillus massiliensis]MCT2036777.1 ABC transporter substrate-binding protein [Helcobacillus massiliensis]MCT2332470.1 ABC transporter substrate-binding protein [Helcobacillus massiliensis]MDK7742650.1 ABC transporter substrate-binding protein [Helcobacillus massiliensis]WOO92588.1 ABC transporter substrate-binding protein [Helcobacillus massiliensis]
MEPRFTRRGLGAAALAGTAAAALAACGAGSDPLKDKDSSGGSGGGDAKVGKVVRIGSQDYYSNEVIAELFALVIEKAGGTVDRQYRIGQREVYMSEIEAGKIDLFPEYLGNTLQYFQKDATAKTAEEIHKALGESMPKGWEALAFAEAADQDSINTTAEFAKEHSLKQLGDLAGIKDLKVAANSEFEARPYGPKGLKKVYGADVSVVGVEDSGGPLTVKALLDGDVQLADIYSADPAIKKNGFVTLEDPKSLILPQNVVPLAKSALEDAHKKAVEGVIAKLTTDELIALNTDSVDSGAKASAVAEKWLKKQGLL